MRSLHRVFAIALLVLTGVLAGFLTYRSTHRPTLRAFAPAQTAAAAGRSDGAATSAGTATPTQPPAAARVPETVPDVSVPDMAGAPKSLRAYLGHPLIINFWATWCSPCRRELPLLQQLWTRHRPDGLQIVGVAVDSASAVQQYLRRTPINYPLLVGEEQGTAAAASFGVDQVLPFSVFADAQGQIVAVKIGELHQAEADFIIAAMGQIAQGRETIPQARVAIAAQLRVLAIQRAKMDAAAAGPS